MSERHTVDISGELLELMQTIRNCEQTSYKDLIARTGINTATVSLYTRFLRDMGLVSIVDGPMVHRFKSNIIRWTGGRA